MEVSRSGVCVSGKLSRLSGLPRCGPDCSSSLGAGGSPDAGLELESSAANLIAKLAMVHAQLTGRHPFGSKHIKLKAFVRAKYMCIRLR